MELTRINNDTNGNPRYVVHFVNLISDHDQEIIREWHKASIELMVKFGIEWDYEYQTSEECILETIQANNYTFNELGKIEY